MPLFEIKVSISCFEILSLEITGLKTVGTSLQQLRNPSERRLSCKQGTDQLSPAQTGYSLIAPGCVGMGLGFVAGDSSLQALLLGELGLSESLQ